MSANCPSCGGQVEFRIDSSFVTVCPFCSAAVARSDRGFEDRGKVIDLIDSQSPLDLWLEGRHENIRFQIVGRAQIRHGAGGVWDEWYCAFDDGKWGWLAEAQGEFYLSFESPLGEAPAFASLSPGLSLSEVGDGVVVAEIGEAEILGAQGEIPYLLESGKKYSYADLSGKGDVFGTLDYSDAPPTLYLGHKVTLDGIGIAASAPVRDESAARAASGPDVSAHVLECPNCRGALELVAPDQCERIACPFCGALSNVSEGTLSVLKILDKEAFPDPPISLGSKGEFEGHLMSICGYMVRSSIYEGETFYWDEYLMYHPRVGFRWLVACDGHWSYCEPASLADIGDEGDGSIEYLGRRYKKFDETVAYTKFVLGQFYWNVEIGEAVQMRDFTSPPYSLSEEKTKTEITWSRSRYLAKSEVEKTFGVELDDPKMGTVGLGQPNPYSGSGKYFAALLVLAIVVMGYVRSRAGNHIALEQAFEFAPKGRPGAEMAFSEPFTLQGDRTIEVSAFSPLRNSWVYLQFDLISESSGAVTTFDLPIEYYRGPGWSEGSTTSSKFLKAVGDGSHILRVGIERKNSTIPVRVEVRVQEGAMPISYFLILLLLLASFPLLLLILRVGFEKRRWSDSSENTWGANTYE